MRQTNWAVLTGSPCSGKTSVVRYLSKMGFRVVHETARALIEELLAQGRTLAEIKADELWFEREILRRKARLESNLPGDETIFLDRAVPDSIAYFRAAGFDIEDPLEKSRAVRYLAVFHFERLGFEKDRARAEDEKIAERLDGFLTEAYRMLGYEPIRVPVMTVEQRAGFILERMKRMPAGAFSPPR